MTTSTRRLLVLVAGGLIAMAPAVLAATATAPAPHLLAACNELIDTTDSFSMDCAPTVMPDVSDQLTEAEVAEPGWNARPGGGGGADHGGGGGGGGGRR